MGSKGSWTWKPAGSPGRQGWERDLEATLPYALAVSIEPVGSRIPIYAEIKERVVVPVEVEERVEISE